MPNIIFEMELTSSDVSGVSKINDLRVHSVKWDSIFDVRSKAMLPLRGNSQLVGGAASTAFVDCYCVRGGQQPRSSQLWP